MVHTGPYREAGQVPSTADDALSAAELVVAQAPKDFGRAWVDRSTGGVVLDVVTSGGASIVSALSRGDASAGTQLSAAKGGPSALAGKYDKGLPVLTAGLRSHQVSQRKVKYDGQTLAKVQDDLTRLATPDAIADHVWMTRTDGPNDRVIATVDHLSDGLAAQLATTYGTDLVAVEVAPQAIPVEPANGRWNDTSVGGFYGGARLSMGCTDAFSWYSGSTRMMLTAGHCTPSGGSVSTTAEHMGSVAASSRENYDPSAGTQYLTGQTTYRGDMALVTLDSGKTSAGRIYRGSSESTSSTPVAGMMSRSSQTGDQFCTGGSSRKADGSAGPGEICGWTVDAAGVTYRIGKTAAWWRNVVVSKGKTGWCNRPGDSGSPVYIVSGSSVSAKGILDGAGGGGSDFYAGALDGDDCVDLFTDIYQAYVGFPGYIQTG
jgi:hypothetical protein